MMIHPEGVALFVEVPKTGSTACTTHLRKKGNWFQNGSRGTNMLPGSFPGRHSYPNDALRQQLDQMGVMAYGVVRNPWDRMASLWRASAPGSTAFIDYLKRGKFVHGPIDIMRTQQHTWLKNVDYVMAYEKLEYEWHEQAELHGHLPDGPLPVVNRSKNRATPEWTQEEIDLVAERFRLDVDTYGYEGPS